MESMGLPTSFGSRQSRKIGGNGDDEEPPEERPINLKRSHESDNDENNSDHIKSQFELMGYIFHDKSDSPTINGEVVYRKKHVRLHTRMLKMFPSNNVMKPKHTYFDDDGNEINESNQSGGDTLHASSSDEEMEMPIHTSTRLSTSIVSQFTTQLSSDGNANEENAVVEEKEENVALNINLSIDQDYDSNCVDEVVINEDADRQSLNKKEKKKKRKGKFQMSIPVEIANDKVLKKYWYKRFSLFHLFDFGVRLDRGKFISKFIVLILRIVKIWDENVGK